jgi:hypothetical protein
MKVRLLLYSLMLFALMGGATPATLSAASGMGIEASPADEVPGLTNPLSAMGLISIRCLQSRGLKALSDANITSNVVVRFNPTKNVIEYLFQDLYEDILYRVAPLLKPTADCIARFKSISFNAKAQCANLAAMASRATKPVSRGGYTTHNFMLHCIQGDIATLQKLCDSKPQTEWSNLEILFLFSIYSSIKIATDTEPSLPRGLLALPADVWSVDKCFGVNQE